MSQVTVDLQAVAHRFGGTPALRDVTVRLFPGVTAVLGPNGAGKTTLLRVLATVLRPDAGRVTLFGCDPSRVDDRRAIRRRLGYLPQEPRFHQSFTAFEFLDYIGILKELVDRRVRHDEIRRVLRVTQLSDVSQRRIRTLSAGMRQRLALAQALLRRPDLLVLDEPTDGLDPVQRLEFRQTVSELGGPATVVLATHRIDDVTAICNRVLVLHRGACHFDGTPHELAALAAGKVWYSAAPHPGAEICWRASDGRYRSIAASPPSQGAPATATAEDGYLLLVGSAAVREAVA